MSHEETDETRVMPHHRRKGDGNPVARAWETILQYKALGGLCVILLFGAGVVFYDMRADAKLNQQRDDRKNEAVFEMVKQNAGLAERSNVALENSTRAVENNTRVISTFTERMDRIEHRMDRIEDK